MSKVRNMTTHAEYQDLPTASRRVTVQLVRGILNGSYRSGDKLPTERELAEDFSVSRHVVREALKRLETLGLVRIRQGSGAHVNDVGMTGGIELFEYLVRDENGELDYQVVRDYLVFYRQFAKEVVRMAARSRTEKDLALIENALIQRAKVLEDLPQLAEMNQRLFQLVARATHNHFYQLVFNNLGRITGKLRSAVPLAQKAHLAPQPQLEALVFAIRAQDGAAAAEIVERLTAEGETLLRAWEESRNG